MTASKSMGRQQKKRENRVGLMENCDRFAGPKKKREMGRNGLQFAGDKRE